MINVYLADDDREDQEIFELALKAVKPESVVTAMSSGKELLVALYEWHGKPDVIFLDINMPEMNGFDTLQQLKSVPAFSAIPVIIFTVSGKKEDAALMRSLGADYFITKPLEYGRLLDVITKAVEKKQNGNFERSGEDNFIIR